MIRKRLLLISAALAVAGCQSMGTGLEAGPGIMPLVENVAVESVNYRGRDAVRVQDSATSPGERMVLLPVQDFHNGVIEGYVAGVPLEGAIEAARGFVGLAFRVQLQDPAKYEAFYIRPTNGRADDQIRRNHSTQYISHPDFTWHRLREENPGVYESYADMVPGEWTKFRIEVEGEKARLFLHGNPQPALIVNDLKQGPNARGGVALWIGVGTDAHFSGIKVTPGE